MSKFDTETVQERTSEEVKSYRLGLGDEWLPYLQKHGYVVLTEILSHQDVETVKGLIWTDLEGAHRLSRNDTTTWKNWQLPYHGIDASLAQTAGPWYIRGHQNVQKAFSRIWSTTDLITSMDAVILWRSDSMHDTEGLHLDQNPFTKPHLDCVQGMVPLLPVNQYIGGLQVVPFSHTEEARERYCERHPENAHCGDFLLVDASSSKPGMLLECEPGDLILWDSRTIHGGTVGPRASGNLDEIPHLTRMAINVAMTPRAWATEAIQEARRKGFEKGVSFNHCPHEAGTSTGTLHARRRKGYNTFSLTESQKAVL